jgi:uncharacterized membrane protein YdbT with pleckstrin-like domain
VSGAPEQETGESGVAGASGASGVAAASAVKGATATREPGRGGRPDGSRLHPITPWRRAWAPIAALIAFSVHDVERTRQWLTELTAGWLIAAFAVLLPVAAAYGFLSWWCTSYLVTDTELRIRTGLFFRRTAHIRLDRIQAVDVARPLLARVVGFAKLKLDVVGTESKDELAFLGERDAVALRAELLARAAGIVPDAASEAGEAPAREMLRVETGTLLMSLLLSAAGWGVLGAAVLIPVLVYLGSGSPLVGLATFVPMAGGVWKVSGGRFAKEYDWTVAESPDGLRLDHGLLERDHATVPPGRVQCVWIAEPPLWRPLGWARVGLEVAGAGKDKGGLLIPVASWEAVTGVLAHVLPGVDLAAATAATTRAPNRSRWCAPLVRRAYAHGVTASVFVTRHGRLNRRTTLVPHAKVQSVRLEQGPWQRALRLADVSVDNGAGGTATARLRDADEAHALVHAQAARSRTGRREARPERWLT